MLTVSRKKLVVLLAIVFVAVIGGGIYLLVIKKDSAPSQNEDANTQGFGDEEFTAVEKANDEYVRNKEERINNLAAETQSVDDLLKQPEADQGPIGLQIIKNKIEANDKAGAKQFIDYLMQRTDSTGIEASVLCYQIADSDSAKRSCRDRLDEQARASGMIGPNETMPESYLQQKDGEG